MPHDDDRRLCARSPGDGFTLPGALKHYPPDLEIEPIHTTIDLAVDVAAMTAVGRVTHDVVARRAGPRSLTLHAIDFEEVVVRDVEGAPLDWSYNGREIRLTWRSAFAAAEGRQVEVAYRVTKPASGLFFSQPSDEYPEAPIYAATDHETERARYWLPCVDLPSVRPRLDFHLTAAEGLTILANGALVAEESNGDGTKTAHWRLDYPCPSYLTCFAIGDFARADDEAFGDVPVAYFTTREHSPTDLLRSFGRTPAMLAWLTTKLGRPFPFPKYYQFALPGFGGAMENISLVSWNDAFVCDEALAREWGYLVDQINVHEMAHSFFGDAVVVRDFAHAWLKESWATYAVQCWLEDTAGDDEALYTYYSNARAYFDEADSRYKRPIVTRTFNTSWDMYDRHLYPGGACRLHTLRHLLGDDVFWPAVKDYVARFEGRVVETEDLRRVMEEHSGRSLVAFFDQWFYSPGYPALKVGFKYDAEKSEGAFEIEQTQEDEEAGVPLFSFDLDLAWTVVGRTQIETVHVEDKKHTFLVTMDEDPDQVRIDPGSRVLHKLDFDPGTPRLWAQLRHAPDVPGRIMAGVALAKTRRPANVAAVADAFRREPFWGVRVRLAEALADAGSEAAAQALAQLVTEEQDPQVLPGLLRAAGKYRSRAIAAAVEDRLATGLGYLAQMAAYEALGAQRDMAPFELLASAAATDGYGGFAQSGALRALAATRRKEALAALVAAAAPGATSNRARPAAVGALGDFGKVLDGRGREVAAETIIDRLRDESPRVRQAAVAALKSLEDARGIPSLLAYREGRPAQEQVAVDRAVAALRAGAKPRAKEREKDLEELHVELRKLKTAVGRLEARVNKDAGHGEGTGGSGEVPGSTGEAGAPGDPRGEE